MIYPRLKFVMVLLFLCKASTSVAQEVKTGRLDLRQIGDNEIVALDGSWEFYWKQLFRPSQITEPLYYFEFPSLWNDQIVGNDTLDRFGFATYRLKILIPEINRDYSLLMDDFYCAYKLYIDGKMMATNGKVGTSKENYRPEWRPQVVDISPNDEVIDVVLQVSNFDHSKGGSLESILFGSSNVIHKEYSVRKNYDIVLTIFFIVLALFFLVRFGFVSLDIASFYFSIFCITYSYRIIGTELYILHSFLEDYPWEVGIMMEYVTLFISPFLFGKFLQSIYPNETNDFVLNLLGIIGAVCILITLFFPPVVFTQLVTPFFVILMFYFFYGFTIYIFALLNNRPGAIYGLAGVAVVFGVFTFLIFEYFGWLKPQPHVAFLGYMLFLIAQSLQLYTYSKTKIFQLEEVANLEE
jgi:hypothetical protein